MRVIGRPAARIGACVLGVAALFACGGDGPSTQSADGSNGPPRIDWLNLDPAAPAPGETVRARVRAQDPEGDRIDLRFTWEVGGVPRMETGPTLSLDGVPKGTEVSVVAVATDGLGDSEPAQMATRVRNTRPKLTQAKIVPWETVARGDDLTIEAAATDVDGDPIEYRYEWRVNDTPVTVEGNAFDTRDLEPGDVVVARVVATDGESESDPIDTARVRVAGAVPKIVSSPAGFAADGSFHYQMQVEYLGGAEGLRYALRKGPPGMTVNAATGEVLWRPTRSQSGDHEVELEVADARGTKSVQAFTVHVDGGSGSPPAAPR